MPHKNTETADDSAKKDDVENSTLQRQVTVDRTRPMTAEEAREISRQAIIDFRDRSKWKDYQIEDTGPGGALRGWIPRP